MCDKITILIKTDESNCVICEGSKRKWENIMQEWGILGIPYRFLFQSQSSNSQRSNCNIIKPDLYICLDITFKTLSFLRTDDKKKRLHISQKTCRCFLFVLFVLFSSNLFHKSSVFSKAEGILLKG